MFKDYNCLSNYTFMLMYFNRVKNLSSFKLSDKNYSKRFSLHLLSVLCETKYVIYGFFPSNIKQHFKKTLLLLSDF